MEICIVRHAIAEDQSARYPSDSARPLTPRGKERMREEAAGLRLLYQPQLVVSSPLRRAMETAEILCQGYRLGPMEVQNGLATGEDDTLLEALQRYGRERVLLVGHEPHVSGLLSYLLVGHQERMSSLFKKGAAALVTGAGEPSPGSFGLHWLLQPAALRALGRSGAESSNGD